MEAEKAIIGLGITAFGVYLYWLGRTVFGMAIAVGEIKTELVGNGKETQSNTEEILRLRQRLHKNENTLQEHELRLDALEEKSS